jgi:hypothetical protein
MSNSQDRPQREKELKPATVGGDLTVMENPSLVTQLRLARIQQLQADIAHFQQLLEQEWRTLKEEMRRGAKVETGPIHAFLRKSKSSRRLTLTIK